MKRLLLNFLALLSLLVSSALAALWVRSYFVRDTISHAYVPEPHRHAVAVQARVNCGMADVVRLDVHYGGQWTGPGDLGAIVRRAPPWYSRKSRPPDTPAERYLLAFRYQDQTMVTPMPGLTERLRTVVAPLWAGVVVFAAPPALLLRWRVRARRRARRGLCARCGYDLRESPARCPECGTASA